MRWRQRWSNALFLHFAAPLAEVQRLLPPQLEVDAFGGRAWISYVLFRLRLRPAWLPTVPGFSSLLELNLRTYVRYQGQSGIYFLGMYADNRLAIGAARLLTPFNYQLARIACRPGASGRWHAECQAACDPFGRLDIGFHWAGPLSEAAPGSLDAWLVERYRLFVEGRDGAMLVGEVEHPPWQVFTPETERVVHTLMDPFGLSLSSVPEAMHFSPGVAAEFLPFKLASSMFPTRFVDNEGLAAESTAELAFRSPGRL